MCPRHEDAVQEIFVEIWRNAERLDPDVASEATYITTIARRRLIDKYRRRSRDLDTTSLTKELISGSTDHEEQVDISDEAERARQYMQQLRPEERKVLEMSINDGMSQTQIAEATNRPLGTVRTHARRGFIRLRELLAESAVREFKGAGA
jgi:RNA polymerase sigma-70 factor (ECF subfamily)